VQEVGPPFGGRPLLWALRGLISRRRAAVAFDPGGHW